MADTTEYRKCSAHSHRPGSVLFPEIPEFVRRRFRNMGLVQKKVVSCRSQGSSKGATKSDTAVIGNVAGGVDSGQLYSCYGGAAQRVLARGMAHRPPSDGIGGMGLPENTGGRWEQAGPGLQDKYWALGASDA